MKQWRKMTADCGIGVFLLFISSGVPARFFALEYVDQRFHKLTFSAASTAFCIITALILMASLLLAEYFFLFRSDPERAGRKLWSANWPLLFWLPGWFFQLNYTVLPLYVVPAAWAAARFSTNFVSFGSLSWKRCFQVAAAISLTVGLLCGAGLIWSFNTLAMQWFDWGHFYEALTNTLDGRFFYLDLSQGSFLGSRFCPSLLILLPVVLFRSPELFLLTGALLIASGGVLVVVAGKILKLSPAMALCCGMGFLFMPLALNMMWAQLDGFHEVFLLVPVFFGAWCCYRAGKKRWAACLWIFSLGIRETVGFMWMMWGILLLFHKGRRRDGAIILSVSLVWTALLILWIMPEICTLSSSYEHTVFFPHLGNSISEIALSPFLRPGIFWGKLFSLHNLDFYLALLLPFIPVLLVRPYYLLALLPDLLMVSLDYRFDSQCLLRHYSMVPMLVLTVAAVETVAALQQEKKGFSGRLLTRLSGVPVYRSAAVYQTAAALLSSCCFAQLPGLPAADPRLPEWSWAKAAVEEFYDFIPPGVPVSAGPGMACFFAGRNELNVFRNDISRRLFDRVVIESFMAVYGENALRIKLLQSGKWELKHSVYLDDRLLQLFERRKTPLPDGAVPPDSVVKVSDRDWAAWGSPIPCRVPELEMRGRISGKHLLVAVRIVKKFAFDAGFNVRIRYAGEKDEVIFFRSFGDGSYPACLALPGETWVMGIPLEGRPERCQVDIAVIPVAAGKIYK